MPVLNVPFRLIYAWNPQRDGVLDNNLQPAKDIGVPLRRRHDVLSGDVRAHAVDTAARREVGDGSPGRGPSRVPGRRRRVDRQKCVIVSL